MDCNALYEMITESQLAKILNENKVSNYRVIKYDIGPASEGLTGFVGEHSRIVLYLKKEELSTKIHLFVKSIPKGNKPKAQFITENKFFARESFMFKIIAKTGGSEGDNPWGAKAYVHSENLIVMPDLSVQGYTIRPLHEYLELDHVLVTIRSVARLHATFANYFTRISNNDEQHKLFLREIKDYLTEPNFFDSPWLRAAAKLTANFLKEFSLKYDLFPENLEEKLIKQNVEACDDLKEYPETLNVIVHKDLWTNNIMFKYEDDVPINAILIDYQCTRYAPPAFDVVNFLYLTTSRAFRVQHEKYILSHYLSLFTEHLDCATTLRLKDLSYNLETFTLLCEKARKFGMMMAITIFPFVLMEAQKAQATYDNPETYFKYLYEDRSEPVIAYAKQCQHYKERQLEIFEEFVERYISKLND